MWTNVCRVPVWIALVAQIRLEAFTVPVRLGIRLTKKLKSVKVRYSQAVRASYVLGCSFKQSMFCEKLMYSQYGL